MTGEGSWEAMIWVGPVLLGLIIVSLIGICVWAMVHLSPEETTQDRKTRTFSTHRRDIPGDDIIGAEPLGWTALDDLQLQRFLGGAS